jgi:hypothetical protein
MTSEIEPKEPQRRAFFVWLTRIFLSLWGVGIIGVISSFIRAPSLPRSAGLNTVRAGEADTLNPGEARLVRKCPCHNGVFSATGDVISGLPTKPLPTLRVEVRRGEILVHL